jgi:hypothetical protein
MLPDALTDLHARVIDLERRLSQPAGFYQVHSPVGCVYVVTSPGMALEDVRAAVRAWSSPVVIGGEP